MNSSTTMMAMVGLALPNCSSNSGMSWAWP